MIKILMTALGAFAGTKLAEKKPWLGATAGAVGGLALSDAIISRQAVPLPSAPPETIPAEGTQGLGYFWIWSKDYYTVWNGSKYLPMRYTTRGAAMDWYLDVHEANWNRSVYLLKRVGGSWVRQ